MPRTLGITIGPDGHIHSWTAPRNNSSSAFRKSMPLPKAWSSDCATSRSMQCLFYVTKVPHAHLTKLLSKAHALQCTTAGPYNAFPTSLLGVGSVCGLAPDLVGIRSVFDFAHACAQLQLEKRNFLLPPWLVAPRKRSILYVAWIIMVNLMRLPQDKKQKVATTLLRDE